MVGDLHSLINNEYFDIHGRLPDGRQISLIDCIRTGPTEFHGDKNRTTETNVYPHFVAVGHESICSTDRKISKITYQCENAHLFCAFSETFGTIHSSPEALDSIIESAHKKLSENHPDDDWSHIRRQKSIGDHPLIGCFDGNFEIAELNIPSGRLSIQNVISYGAGSPMGVKIKNTIFHTIEFREPQSVNKAIHDLRSIHQFYELLLGSRQRYKKIQLSLTGIDERTHLPLRLLWNRCNHRVKKRNRSVHPTDIPVLASTERTLFEEVLANWMSTSPSMEASRHRLLNGLLSNAYSYDRIIGSANMYDLLPAEKTPESEQLAPNLSEAVVIAKESFRNLDQSAARDSVLSALGRTGKPSLKTKILHRANIVKKTMGIRFEDLDLVCHHAVQCRNHYVHGSTPSFEYDKNFSGFVFLTDTLEFIFYASDLIECGWKPQDFLSRHGTLSHFVGQYIINYQMHLNALKQAIRKT